MSLISLAHAGYHAHQVLNISHLFDLLIWCLKVLEIKLILADLLFQLRGLLFIKLQLSFFHQGSDITHPQDPLRHPFGIKYIKCLQLFAAAYKLDRFIDSVFDRKRSTAPGIPVKFGKHDSREKSSRSLKALAVFTASWPVIESTTKNISCGFTAVSIFGHLGHHDFINGQPARRIDNHHIFIL